MASTGTSDWTTIGLAGALVLVTAYYAIKTSGMLREMRAARGAQIMPRVALAAKPLTPNFFVPVITNVGMGPAVDVSLVLSFQSRDGHNKQERTWRSPLLAPGEKHEMLPAHDEQGTLMNAGPLNEAYPIIQLIGTCKDALGQIEEVNDQMDAEQWWGVLMAANERRQPEYERETLETFKAMKESLDRVATVLQTRSR